MSLAELIRRLLTRIADMIDRAIKQDTYRPRFAEVTSTNPVLIRYDTDGPSTIPPFVPTHVRPLAVGDRVQVGWYKGQTTILGRAGTAIDINRLDPEFVLEARVPGDRVIQSFDLDPATGEFYLSQAVTSSAAGADEDTIIYRVSPGGHIIDQMRLIGAGHGSNITVERSGGYVWVWLRWTWDTVGSNPAQGVRVRYRTGNVLRNAANIIALPHTPGTGYTLYSVDAIHDRVCVRYAPSGTETYYLYDKTQFLAGNASPLHTIGPLPYPSSQGEYQGHTTYGDQLFISYGGTGGTPAQSPSYVYQYAWPTGQVKTRDITSAGRGVDGQYVGNHVEAEGNAVWVGANGVPQLLFGLAVGPVGGRRFWVSSFRPSGADILSADSLKTLQPGVPFAMAAGQVTISVSNSTGATADISYPVGRFTVPPRVQVTKASGGGAKYVPYTTNRTSAGCRIGVYAGDGTAGTQTVVLDWVAVQMTPDSAEG